MREPYIAYPKAVEGTEDLPEFVLIKNKYSEELNTPIYIAFNNEKDAKLFLDYSLSQTKRFYNKKDNLENVGIGDTLKECVDDLIKKSNSVSQLN